MEAESSTSAAAFHNSDSQQAQRHKMERNNAARNRHCRAPRRARRLTRRPVCQAIGERPLLPPSNQKRLPEGCPSVAGAGTVVQPGGLLRHNLPGRRFARGRRLKPHSLVRSRSGLCAHGSAWFHRSHQSPESSSPRSPVRARLRHGYSRDRSRPAGYYRISARPSAHRPD